MAKIFRISGLMCADWFAYYILWMMMVYLIDVWKIEFTKAAAIINIWRGCALVLPLAFDYLASTILGNFSVLLFTSLSYTVGLGLLWISTPSVLGKSSGSCTEYKADCIGDTHKQLFYAALALMAMGKSGHIACLITFMVDQAARAINGVIEAVDQDRFTCCMACGPMLGCCIIGFIPITGYLVGALVKSWAVKFGLIALFTLVALLFFLSGVFSYEYVRPQGSTTTTIFRVIVAGFSKMLYRHPQDVSGLYEKGNDDVLMLPHTNGLRCLDKAAIILPQPSLEQQEQHRWRLCRVTEVEATKIGIRLIPLYITFIICGVISILGETHFLAQATTLNPTLGSIEVPLIFFLWIQNMALVYIPGFILTQIAKIFGNSPSINRYMSPIGVAVAMVFSTLCCIVAAKVETKRLNIELKELTNPLTNVIEAYYSIRVPMTVFWLIPQFVLLGIFDGICGSTFPNLVNHVAPQSMLRHFNLVRVGVHGVGYIGSILSVFAVGRISKLVTGMSWLQGTLNKSRLDNYYWVLAALSAVNLVVFIVIACFNRYKGPVVLQWRVQENGEAQVKIFDPFGFNLHGSFEYSWQIPMTSSDNVQMPSNYTVTLE